MKKSRVPRAPKTPVVPWTLNISELKRFRASLLKWFHREKRVLPWRERRDPYRIWISEIMLQQTRVAAVIPYYERFLKRFPTIQALAHARIESVLQLWAGLGYYSRARNLHRAAKEIVMRHGGEFPRTMEDTLALSGIGAYSSAAILSIAYGFPAAVLDGNVARVLARLGAVRGDLRAPRHWSELRRAADTLLDAENPSDWNESMMELGATICTPRAPRCDACPVADFCRAYELGIQNELPAKRFKRAAEQLQIAAAVLLDPHGRTLLIRPAAKDVDSESAALFSRMWQFPAVIVRSDAQAELAKELQNYFKPGKKFAPLNPQLLDLANHTVTFRQITLAPYLVRVKKLPRITNGSEKQIALASVAELAVSSATRKIAAIAVKAVTRAQK
jgi:A/G-specific adenine glycosylase